MKIAEMGLFDLEDRVLSAIVGEIMRTVFDPAIQDGLVAIMVIVFDVNYFCR